MSSVYDLDTENVGTCLVCGSEGNRALYAGLRDRLFGVPGEWTYKRCLRCGLIFLDPRPTLQDIAGAYAVYPTHAPATLPDNLSRRLRSYVREGYLANKLGYTEGIANAQRLAGWLIYLHPGQREYVNGSVMYLPAAQRGRVLDVGAGAGEVLKELSRLGWEVEGVDPDPAAAQTVSSNHGLSVRMGMMEDQGYPTGHFDTVVMSHVIEHVHDPVNLLKECRRVLQPGGSLVVATPNAESLGHSHFGSDWRVLEPPRHLTIFSRKTLHRLATEAGFYNPQIRTTVRGADGIYIESKKLREAGVAVIGQEPVSRGEKARAQIFQYLEWAAMHLRSDLGEELLLMATK